MFSLDSLVPWLLQSSPSPHPCLRENPLHFSLKAACCPRLGQSWESQRAHRLVAEQCPGEMSPLRLLPQHPGLLSTAEERSWPSPASLAGEKMEK